MARHAAPGPAPRPRRGRPAAGLIGWGAFAAVLTGGALLWTGVEATGAVAVAVLLLAGFALVWTAGWLAAPSSRPDESDGEGDVGPPA